MLDSDLGFRHKTCKETRGTFESTSKTHCEKDQLQNAIPAIEFWVMNLVNKRL